MDAEKDKNEPSIEQLLIIMACTLQLRGGDLELEELIFLKQAIDKGIDSHSKEIPCNENHVRKDLSI